MANQDRSNILDHLNSEQLEAVTCKGKPLIIIAGAGSGKTRVLTRRIAYRIASGDAEARHTLAITFTKKAALELSERLRLLEMRDRIEAHTFHAAALRILQRYWESKGSSPFELLESKYRLVSQALASLGTLTKDVTPQGGRSPRRTGTNALMVSAITSEIEWAKARALTPSGYAKAVISQKRSSPLTPSEMAQVFSQYEQLKAKAKRLDFDDLILHATWALKNDDTFCAQERYRVRHLYVDEFQDVNASQTALLDALMGERTDLCVVGDPNQAIYAWNGADPALLANVSKRYPESKTVILSHNYRSTPQILALASRTLAKAGASTPVSSRLEPNLKDGPIPVIRSFEDERAEALAVARLAKRAGAPTTRWSEIAVLARTNAQLLEFQHAFSDLGIPNFMSGERDLLSQNGVREIVTDLERGITTSKGSALFIWLDEAVSQAHTTFANSAQTLDYLNLLLNLSHDHLRATPMCDSRALAQWLRMQGQQADEASANHSIALTTFHRAKGLEWKTVFIVGMEDGFVPISRAETIEALDEERRLLYVAITRAKRELTLTWARKRRYNERFLRREPSPHLAALEDEIFRLSGRIATPHQAMTTIKAMRRQLGSLEEREELSAEEVTITGNLRIWRANKAKELGIPGHLIIHDRALEAIVRKKPAGVEDLSRIAGIGPTKAFRYGKEIISTFNL